MRRSWLAVGVLAAVVTVAGVAWARSVRTDPARVPARVVSDAATRTPADDWCVPVSRSAALRAVPLDEATTPTSTPPSTGPGADAAMRLFAAQFQSKLIAWSEWSNAPDPERARPSRWWLVEIQGGPFRVAGKSVSWELVWIDARSGAVRNESAGTGAPPARWTALVDHGERCATAPQP